MLRRLLRVGFPLLLSLLLTVALTGCADAANRPASQAGSATVRTSALAEGDPLAEDDALFFPTETTVRETATYRDGVWDSALLPNDFPAPVPTAEVRWTMYTPAAHGDDAAWSLSLVLTASQWRTLTEAFTAAGWAGGGVDVLATGDMFLDGVWVNARYCAAVYRSDYDLQSGLYTVEITVTPRREVETPAALAARFPVFTAGYSRSGCRVDEAEGVWVYGGTGCFCGVRDEAEAAYRQTLADAGYTLSPASSAPGLIGWVAVRDTLPAGRVEGTYDPVCGTLELIYTAVPADG